ncbi:3-dehydroquinate synthase [Leptospira biflexa]|uniref:3-dehydroquinate synthase n=1 Tax=Leptospira biflexa TaxID=172 RepID=UPI001083D22F|nr:3-dehydroquinate synthase [Leptospira biflexa]TGM33668.1 3-dehydroquinate synthase [Leptospira biflexa]TGM34494.1 3-dehydroquinate synthase [Leptospira biflexa]
MKENRSKSIRSEFQVTYEYDVFFTKELFSLENILLSEFFQSKKTDKMKKKVLVVIDQGLFNFHNKILESIPQYFQSNVESVQLIEDLIILPGGEKSKNDSNGWELVVSAINQYGIDRHSYLMVIGGGAILDMVGYAAAVAHRGIRLIRIPTTVLSQNDSGVGVKNSINYFGKKNFLGTFAPPVAVFNDSSFLVSLEDRDWRSGMAEAVKVSLIKNKVFFEWMESHVSELTHRDLTTMEHLVYECARLHMEHIQNGDPFEFGSSRPLDFGHWFAHKLEYLANFSIRHGEAVAIGMALDSIYSYLSGFLQESELNRIINLLRDLGFQFNHPVLLKNGKENLELALKEFQEHLGGKLTLLMLEGIGFPKEVYTIHLSLLESAYDRLVGWK